MSKTFAYWPCYARTKIVYIRAQKTSNALCFVLIYLFLLTILFSLFISFHELHFDNIKTMRRIKGIGYVTHIDCHINVHNFDQETASNIFCYAF